MQKQRPLDQIEKETYNPRGAPHGMPAQKAALREGVPPARLPEPAFSLDGEWEMIQDGNADRVYEAWDPAQVIPAAVPGSVHAALAEAGVIPDPTVGKNDAAAREKSAHFWWLRKAFRRPAGFDSGAFRLEFGGICDRCTIWLNGRLLGSHQGMFGGPEYDVSDLLEDENTLLVMLYPAPFRYDRKEGELNPFFDGINVGWLDTTVFNCVYGWHYANIPALGIWQPVVLRRVPAVEIASPFVRVNSLSGNIGLYMELAGPEGGFEGELRVSVEPENFTGPGFHLALPVESRRMKKGVHLEFDIPEPRLWWPNGLGAQDLYRLTACYFNSDGGNNDGNPGAAVDCKELCFGIRTIEMAPCMGEAKEDTYNWQFVVNGEPVFIKGTNWCTLDYAMRFTNERYSRFLSLAKNQHIQLLRAWGGGMPETAGFYDLCDRYGILVLQEFATAWDSQKVQPAGVLREGVERTVRRLRSRTSLAMWGGGNESERPTDAVIDMMGRLVYELDGTRIFHRNDPWGGSSHNYNVYWGRGSLEFNLSYKAPFIGEFGFASSPNIESVRKYLAEEDMAVWPPVAGGSLEYHTPVFNTKSDMEILRHYIPEFMPDTGVMNMVLSTQLCQATALRNTLELARTRRPEATGICYYKLTDVFPSVSWSTIDWYGATKMAYYFVQDSYEPLHACLLLDTYRPAGKGQACPVWLLDDAGELEGASWHILCRAYDGALRELKRQSWDGCGIQGRAEQVGEFSLSPEETASSPLLLVVELAKDGVRAGRTFYWQNFDSGQGCLMNLPRTSLSLEKKAGAAAITNIGQAPAVGAHFLCEQISHAITLGDNFVWIDPGETVEIKVDMDGYDGVAAWNA